MQFLSTPSARRATRGHAVPALALGISIHALREEGDASRPSGICSTAYFYPRPPRGGRPFIDGVEVMDDVFLSTPSARRATGLHQRHHPEHRISIHALREEGDLVNISLRLCEGQFLSTPSARRATPRATFGAMKLPNFYPRPPRGGRHKLVEQRPRRHYISIHALREEGDDRSSFTSPPRRRFLSTPSARRATCQQGRGGGDFLFLSTPSARRATRYAKVKEFSSSEFLSTPSARRATGYPAQALWPCRDFYPRPPRGGRPTSQKMEKAAMEFLSTPSARRATRQNGKV